MGEFDLGYWWTQQGSQFSGVPTPSDFVREPNTNNDDPKPLNALERRGKRIRKL
jgi:hypothetical protein